MLVLAVSLFFAEPAPIDMPRAEAYLVREDGRRRLEDRFDPTDLWVDRAVTGRWTDGDGRIFLLARLATCPPSVDHAKTVTRTEFVAHEVPMKRVRPNADFPRGFRDAVELLSPCPVVESPRSPRQMPHGYKEVYYWQEPTNSAVIVCTFLKERETVWSLATWQLAEGDDYPLRMSQFEDAFLRQEFPSFQDAVPPPVRPPAPDTRHPNPRHAERELLRADARHSVAAYPNWHASSGAEFEVLDDLPASDFVKTLTNDFTVMRAKYAAALPTPLDGSNVLCVARLYADRDEYLDALETEGLTNLTWTAAYWCPLRRELVAYLPEKGEEELLKTVRHEAFHQYLSYATSMIEVSPWLNEGYAQYFEDEQATDFCDGFELAEEGVERASAAIPALLSMDYEQFYGGTDVERRFKYCLALSVVRFIEKGADEVRLKPFEGLKARYFEALFETKDMRRATHAAFKDADTLKRFVAEWKKFLLKK